MAQEDSCVFEPLDRGDCASLKIVAQQNGESTEQLMKLALWESIEANCGIIAGSAICSKMFFKKVGGKKRRQCAGGGRLDGGEGEASRGGERERVSRRVRNKVMPEDEGWGPERRSGGSRSRGG